MVIRLPRQPILMVLLVLLAIIVPSTIAEEAITLEPGKELKKETIATMGDYKYYKFKIAQNFGKDKDITIQTALLEEDPWANPNIYLAKTTQTPTADDFQIACHSYGEDICTINKNEIKGGDEWYVGVTCEDPYKRSEKCSYDIVLEFVEEMVIQEGLPQTVYLYENDERIFKYFVPNNTNIRHVQISARAQDAFSKFEMLTVKGNDAPGTDRRRHAWPAWNNGYVSRFEPGCDCFCIDCNYTALLKAETPGYYTITAKTSETVEDIQTGELYDNVFRGRNNCYRYYVSDPNSDFRVKMKVYSGDPDLYVHPKELQHYLKQFKYNSLEKMESEELVLTPKMRTDDSNVIGDYYICVMGKLTSSFKLELHNDDTSTHMLESGLTESGYLEKGEFVNYWYREDILKEKTNITFQLHAMSGTTTLRTKFCSAGSDLEESKNECLHNKEELEQPIADEQSFYQLGQEIIQHDPSECTKSNSIMDYIRYAPPSCMYNIGIIGVAEGKSHYGVTIRHQEGHHVLLFEGKTFEGSLVQGQYDYYKISINDDTITELTIQLLSVHGDPDLFVSQKDEFPTDKKFERKATICGRYPDTISFKAKDGEDENLVGDYYIGVFGYVESTYHLYYHTERTDEDEEGNVQVTKLPVTLNQNKPVRGVLRSKDDYLLYKFNLANSTNEEEVIIRLTPQNGKFNYTVKYNEKASKTNYDKFGSYDNHYTVVFNPVKEPEFKDGEYNIYVYPVLADDLESSGMSFTFTMSYHIGSHHIPLLDDQQTLGFMKSEKINYYSYAFRTETEEIKFTLTKMTGNVEAIISLNQTVMFPTREDVNEDYGIYHTTTEKNTLSKTKIEKFCKHDPNGYCIMSVGIHSLNTNVESQYVVTATAVTGNETSISKLENGVPQKGSIVAGEWQYFYYKTSNSEPVYAVTVPTRGDPNVYVSIVSDLNQKQKDWHKPTTRNHLKKSEDSIGSDVIMLTKDDLKDCGNSCVLVFGVQAHSVNSAFTITVTRGIVMLRENEAFSGSLGAWGNYKFYEYYRPCSGCTTVISANTLENEVINMFVNFNTTARINTHQEESFADFKMTARGSKELVISPKDLIDKGYSDAPGYFFIEIHSHANITFTITASSNQDTFYPVSKGLPTEYNISQNNTGVYFMYRHESAKGFVIKLQEQYGFANVLVNPVPTVHDGELKDYLPENQSKATWSTFDSESNSLEISSRDSKFCKKCDYIIRIESSTLARGTITVQEVGEQTNKSKMTQLKMGIPITVEMEDIEFHHYKFIISQEHPITINMNVLSGEVEYDIAMKRPTDEEFGVRDGASRESTLLYHGTNTDEHYMMAPEDVHYHVGQAYFITVKSKTPYSKFVLSASYIGQYKQISETTPYKIRVDKEHHLFYYNIDPSPGKSKIIVEAFPSNKREKFSVHARVVDVDDVIHAGDNNNPGWELTADEILKDDKHHTFKFDNEQHKDLYMHVDVNVAETDPQKMLLIVVKADSDKPLGSLVDLYVAASNVQPLKLGSSHVGTVENKQGVFKIFEAYVPHLQNETYVVEVTPCFGQAEVFITRSFTRLLAGKYISSNSHLANGRIYSVLENKHRKTKKYLVAVKSLNNVTEEYKDYSTTTFTIETRKYPAELAKNSYLEKYYIPSEGELEWEINDDGDLKVTWPRIYNSEGTNELPADQTSYEIYISPEQRTGLESPCSIGQLYEPIGTGSDNFYTLDVDKYEDVNDLYINIIGYVIQEDGGDQKVLYGDYPVAYRPLKIHMANVEPKGEDGSLSWFFLFVVIFVIVLLGICALMFYRRYKRVQRKLDFEVREVRHADFGQEMKPTKVYNRFSDPENSQA